MDAIRRSRFAPDGGRASEIIKVLGRLRYNAAFNYATLFVLAVVTGVLSLLLSASYYGLPLFWAYFSVPAILALNLLPPVLLVLLAFFISGRAWIGFSVPSLLILALAVTGFFKIQIRGDPLIAADLALVVETGKIMSGYTFLLNWKIFFAAAIYTICVVFSVFLLKRQEKRPAVRTVGTISALVLSGALFVFVYSDTAIYKSTGGAFEAAPWVFTDVYISKGFVYPFLHSARRAEPELPVSATDEPEMEPQVALPTDIPDEKKLNVISIMLESYTDLSVFGGIEYLYDVYGPLHRLQEESVSGDLITNIFGGGTIDTERLFLTGFTKLESIEDDTNSFVRYLRGQGYYTEGFHSGDGWFYDRVNANKWLGFDEYYYLEDFEVEDRSDEFFFATVKEMYDRRDKSVPYFSYSLTFQNHGAYTSEWTEAPYVIAKNDLTDMAYNILNNYLTGIYDTTSRLEQLVESFRDDPDPVVILIFGDHKPWLGNYDFVYHELGINISLGTAEGVHNFYSAPYIMWANDAAKELTGESFTGEGGSFSPCFLMDELFRRCSWPGDEYMQALRRLRAYADVINTPTGLFRSGGELTLELTGQAKEYWDSFRVIEYQRRTEFTG